MYRNVLALLPTELLVRPVIDGSVSLEGGPAVAFAYEAAHQQL
jgi:hypothetical protein